MQLAILCNGLGTRLGDLSRDTPKALMNINGRPFLEILIEEYRKAGFTEFVLLAGHLGAQLKKYESKDIEVIIEKEQLGTGGAVISALPHLYNSFFVANGDTFIKAESLIGYLEYAKNRNSALIHGKTNAGLFSFNKKDLLNFNKENLNLEKDIIKNIKPFHMYITGGKHIDIGTPEKLEEFKLPYKNKAVFVDRDGTLIKYIPYISDPKYLELKQDVVNKLKQFKSKGYLIIMISNQSGIKQGLITLEQHNKVHDTLIALLKEQNMELDGHTYCFATKDTRGKLGFMRKPNPGMLIEAENKFDLDLSRCIMVGDRDEVDLECGRRAKVGRCYLVHDFCKEVF